MTSEETPGENTKDTAPSELELARAEAEKYKNEYLYLRAEFDTYRRNVIKERAETLKYGSERLIVDLLSVVDNFERALKMEVTSENLPGFVKGIEMTASEFRSVLGRFGVSEVPCDSGIVFDPAVHDALSSESSNTVEPGHVLRVLRKPFKLHEKVVRPAQVVVARAPEKVEK